MKSLERKGIAFGFSLAFIWLTFLTMLTVLLSYDRMRPEQIRVIQPTELEVIPLQELAF